MNTTVHSAIGRHAEFRIGDSMTRLSFGIHSGYIFFMFSEEPSRMDSVLRRLEQSALRRPVSNAQVIVRQFSRDTAAGCTLQKSDLKEIRFVNIFDGVDFFAQDSGDCVDTHRSPAE